MGAARSNRVFVFDVFIKFVICFGARAAQERDLGADSLRTVADVVPLFAGAPGEAPEAVAVGRGDDKVSEGIIGVGVDLNLDNLDDDVETTSKRPPPSETGDRGRRGPRRGSRGRDSSGARRGCVGVVSGLEKRREKRRDEKKEREKKSLCFSPSTSPPPKKNSSQVL